MTSRLSALLSFALVLVLAPLDAAASTYRNLVAQVPTAPDSTQSVRIWMNSDTAFGETAGVETQIGSVYSRYAGTYDATSYPGANWYADIPAQSAGTFVQYQLFTRNESSIDYGFTGFNWNYTVLDVDAGSAVDGGSATDAGEASDAADVEDVADAGEPDTGTAVDSGSEDATEVDAGALDAGEPADAGVTDAGAADAADDVASMDTAVSDSGSVDAGVMDTAVVDSGTDAGSTEDVVATDVRADATDTGVRDAGSDGARADTSTDAPGTMNNSGCNCRATGRSSRNSVAPLIALAALAIRRRRRERV